MAIYKLLDDFYEHSYTLIAIHGSLADYKLAYLLNLEFQIKLQRLNTDVNIAEEKSVPTFKWFDDENEVSWALVKNKTSIETSIELANVTTGLFGADKATRNAFFISEYSKVDYFLKIDEEGPYHKEIEVLMALKKIPGIITAYKVETQQLKSKNNLIFLTNA
ncbi:IPExxxVDY family protein [Galbibacter mesophilus]|uniref:IPExxxVDY family protein n=1 Tax=Galbibacter mesophilus TaxID=379069 RepID=UPI00191EBCEB|nr:IPExxxVDY family protein [Galbibacter mesophilus]MCM5662551.1 IPExxxVDY family protein [Galbibacter mesophilus]